MIEHLTDRQIIALKTQSAPVGEAFTLLGHAASCALCSERIMSRNEMALQMASLREALRRSDSHLSLDELNDVVDGSMLSQEKARVDEHLASCSSCSTHVLELREMARPVPVFQPQRPLFTEWIGAFFTLSRMMGVAAIILLVAVLSGWFLLGHRAEEPQVAALPAEAGSQIGRQVDKKSLPGESGPAQSAKGRDSVLAIALMPGIFRGEGAEKTVHLPAQLDTLVLTLTSRAELTPGRYRVSLADSAGHSIWRKEVVYGKSPDAVAIRVPAKLLAGGRYVVTLSVVESSGTSDSLEEYAVEIVR